MIPGQINVVFGWVWMCFGFVAGMVMGLWAERENWLDGYGSLTRRYLRLAHIAFIALSIINILYGKEIDSVILSDTLKNLGSFLMLFGAVGIPLVCISAAFWRKTKYLLPLPASALLTGTIILVIGLVRS
jgi:hypothetical protein